MACYINFTLSNMEFINMVATVIHHVSAAEIIILTLRNVSILSCSVMAKSCVVIY